MTFGDCNALIFRCGVVKTDLSTFFDVPSSNKAVCAQFIGNDRYIGSAGVIDDNSGLFKVSVNIPKKLNREVSALRGEPFNDPNSRFVRSGWETIWDP